MSPTVDAVAVWNARLRTLAAALGRADRAPAAPVAQGSLAAATARVAELTDPGEAWLALAVLSGVLPVAEEVLSASRLGRLDGPAAFWRQVERASTPASLSPTVRVQVGGVVADVNHTVATELATGIQRVARSTVDEWLRRDAVLPLAWTDGFLALRTLTPTERARLAPSAGTSRASGAEDPGATPGGPVVVVPWGATVLVPELAAEHGRSHRLGALARWSGGPTGVIGFDLVPLTSAETAAEGFASVFYGNLAAVRRFTRIAAISHAAAQEYEGWRRMLGAVGDEGPEIGVVPLPEVAPALEPGALEEARERFLVGDLPLVLVVGSHEPRKNHLAVLHAAERSWRAGARFSLTFVGGNSWSGDEFVARLAELQAAGRPVESASRLSDRLLGAAYRLARCTVFPSLNEGFGLPVAESLAVGTPALTSSYGSMAEIARDGGALLVDPRDDEALFRGLWELLTDDALAARLRAAALERPRRTWSDYAEELWLALTGAPLTPAGPPAESAGATTASPA